MSTSTFHVWAVAFVGGTEVSERTLRVRWAPAWPLPPYVAVFALAVATQAIAGPSSVTCDMATASAVGQTLAHNNTNEDRWAVRRLGDVATLAVVADGMNGHEDGEVAATVAIDALCGAVAERIESGGLTDVGGTLTSSFAVANAAVRAHQGPASDLGTTLLAAVVLQDRVVVGSVGDSRAYLAQAAELVQLTKDHTLAQVLVDRGELSAAQARSDPRRDILVRSLGAAEQVTVDIYEARLGPDSIVLLVTDGVSNTIDDGTLLSRASGLDDPSDIATAILLAVAESKHADEATVVVVKSSRREE